MAKVVKDITSIVTYFEKHSVQKSYQLNRKEEAMFLRLDISNLIEVVNVDIYKTGSINIGGKKSGLKTEFEELKTEFEKNPTLCISPKQIRSCTAQYKFIKEDVFLKIKTMFSTFSDCTVTIEEKESGNINYLAKIQKDESKVTATQFHNGTLLLQGKEDFLFDNLCEAIEKNANPSQEEVAARFVSGNEENLKYFSARYTPELIRVAEEQVKTKLGIAYDFLDEHDKKYLIAAHCLCLTEIPLPEYSPLVMPASKAFEGFVKKTLVSIGLVEKDHFKTIDGNFSRLSDVKNPKRMELCNREKHADIFLKQLDLDVKKFRHFMMHSDGSEVTQVDSIDGAKQKVGEVMKSIIDNFEYFKKYGFLQ